MVDDAWAMELDCTECQFSKVVGYDGGKLPSDHVREHGNETGHFVSLTPVANASR